MIGPGRGLNTVALPELRHGRVALCFSTLLARSTGTPVEDLDFRAAAQAHGIAMGQLAYYRALERRGQARIITDRAALDAHWAAWTAWEATPDAAPPPLGFVISMESADPILDPAQLEQFHALGVRVIGPAHYGPGRYAGGTGTEAGLSADGVALIREMDRLGVILDVTHLSDEAFWPALDIYGGPILASHNNCRTLVPHQRQFSDAQLQAIFARHGVVGAVFDIWMVRADWRPDTTTVRVFIRDVVDHIDHLCQLAGSSRYAAIGSDLDGGFGREASPADLNTVADLQYVAELLQQRGYNDADIAAIMHDNWLQLLRQAWN